MRFMECEDMSGLKYIGGGFFQGVPARDLTDEEAQRYGRAQLLRSGLYVEADKPKAAENKQAAGPQENKSEV